MGLFDFFKKTDPELDPNVPIILKNIPIININSSQSLVPFLGNLKIPENILQMLWFGDGKLQNYNPENDNKVVFENELFRIAFSFRKEPSLIFTGMPVDCKSNLENIDKLGYYPSYEQLNPQQRCLYLKWLCDITQPVDIGYVFIFYYGLERYLISGKYADAINTILTLRQYHKHPSFLSYSASALIISAILHKDKETLLDVLDIIDDTSYCNNLVLLGKFLMQIDLTSDELINLSSAVGFRNKKYINEYPDLFKKSLKAILMQEFGKDTFPFFQLKMQYPYQPVLSFANFSLDQEVRSPVLPDLIHSPEFSTSINAILTTTHKQVKQSLVEMRKAGIAPVPKSVEIFKDDPKPECPYCNNLLDKMPSEKRKCPNCKKSIIVRTDPVDKKKILLREDQVEGFEEKLQHIRCHNAIQRILHNSNIDATQFDQTQENLKMKLGRDPTEKEVALEIVDNLGYYHFKNLDMGLFRNSILNKGDIFKAAGDLSNALAIYLELCYIDLNGPKNCGGSKNQPELLKEYPPFNIKDSSSTFIAPGIINYIRIINNDLNLSKEEIKQIFFEHNLKVQKFRKLTLSVEDAWIKLEPEFLL
jgi:hypothetical protein